MGVAYPNTKKVDPLLGGVQKIHKTFAAFLLASIVKLLMALIVRVQLWVETAAAKMGERKKKQEEVLQSSTVQDVNIFCKSRDNEHEKRNLSPKATSSQLAAALSLNLKS